MSEKNKKTIAVFIIGIIVLAVAITLLVIGILQYKQVMAEYDAAYDDWHHRWWDLHTATLNDMPEHPGFSALMILGIIFIPFGIFITVVGAIIRFSKTPEDLYKEGARKEEGVIGFINNLVKPQPKVCKYCGTENTQDSTKCQSCGAGLSSKK